VVDPVASKLQNIRMEQNYFVEGDSHLTAQIILHLRWYLKALYYSEELKTIQGVPTRFLRLLYFITCSEVTLHFAEKSSQTEVNVLNLLQIPTV
jgi:hypothetical protein